MKKITDLTEVRWHTVEAFDVYGNRVRTQEEYYAKRPVRSLGQGLRFVNLLVDMVAFQVLLNVIGYLVEQMELLTKFNPYVNNTFVLIGGIILLISYPGLYTICEYKWQRTPGKFLTSSWVIDEYGNRPELRALMLRSVIRYVPFEMFSCMGTPSYGWHDRWSKTWVVDTEELATIRRLQEEQSTEVHA
jgi:uncharacterized RDD family membrane protein YckC